MKKKGDSLADIIIGIGGGKPLCLCCKFHIT